LISSKRDIKALGENYKNFFDSSPFSIALMDERGFVIEINKATEKLLGYKREELIGKKYIDLQLHPLEFLPLIRKRYKRLLNGEILEPFEIQVQMKDSRTIWVSVLTVLIKVGGNTYIQSIIQDVNERKLLEQKLQESEAIFKIITEQSFIGIALLQDNVFKYVNQKFSELCGFSIEEILNWGPNGFLNLVHPDDKKLAIEQAKKKQMGSKDATNHYILHGIKKTGETIWGEIFSKTIIYKGRPADFITISDITHKRESDKNLDNFRKDFISRASHELKNPLTSIFGAAELLYEFHKDSMNSQGLEILKIIRNGSKRLNELIYDLLDASRLESNDFILNKKRQNLSTMIKSCIENEYYLIKSREINLKTNISYDVYLNVDMSKIEQVCTNILSNAIKNTPPKGEIVISLSANNSHVEISIKDNGIGLNEEDIKELFKHFSRIHRPDIGPEIIKEGTGLGLYISKQIVEKHGGQIIVESEGRNKGATFIVKLPLI